MVASSLFSLGLFTLFGLSQGSISTLYRYVNVSTTLYYDSCPCATQVANGVAVIGNGDPSLGLISYQIPGSHETLVIVNTPGIIDSTGSGNAEIVLLEDSNPLGPSPAANVPGPSHAFGVPSFEVAIKIYYSTIISVGTFTTTVNPGPAQIVSTVTTTATQIVPVTSTIVPGTPIVTVIGGVTQIVTNPGTGSLSTIVQGGITEVLVPEGSSTLTLTAGASILPTSIPLTVVAPTTLLPSTSLVGGGGVGGIGASVTTTVPSSIFGTTLTTAPTVTAPLTVTVTPPLIGFSNTLTVTQASGILTQTTGGVIGTSVLTTSTLLNTGTSLLTMTTSAP